MASSDQSKGRGRGRGKVNQSDVPPPPSIASSIIQPVEQNVSGNIQTTNPSDGSSKEPSTVTPKLPPTNTATGQGRGRGKSRVLVQHNDYLGQRPIPVESTEIDASYKVSELSMKDFFSMARPTKPNESYDFGERTTVTTNYYRISNYPTEGFIHRYSLKILTRSDEEVHRDRRRMLYEIWLKNHLSNYPNFNRNLIAFDGNSIMVSFNERIPNIDEQGILDQITAPGRSNRMDKHKVLVAIAGEPVNLSALTQLDTLDHNSPDYRNTVNTLSLIKQYLTFALTEGIAGKSTFVYNRTFFTLDSIKYNCWNLGNGNVLWRGFYSCLVFGKGDCQLLMNLDIKHTVFLKQQSFLNFLTEVMLGSPSGKEGRRQNRNPDTATGDQVLEWLSPNCPKYNLNISYLNKICKHMRLKSMNSGKPITYVLKNLGEPANKQKFQWKQKNVDVTVNDYYMEQYQIILKYPYLPLLTMTKKNTYVPMELVDVEPSRVKKITDKERVAMCRYASSSPSDYYNSIDKIRKEKNQADFDNDPFIKAWQLEIDVNMLSIPASVLPTPAIEYHQFSIPSNSSANKGTWLSNERNFYSPQNFPACWMFINFSPLTDGQCYNFFIELMRVAKTRGMQCANEPIFENLGNIRDVNDKLQEFNNILWKNPGCRFCLIILPSTADQRKTIYNTMKQTLELKLHEDFGIVSQMVQEKNAMCGTKRNRDEWDRARLDNILLKINPKLNGVNHIVKVPQNIEAFFKRGHRVMYVGIDLSHLTMTTQYRWSAVAVVASADDIPNRYFKEIYQQKRPKTEKSTSIEHVISIKEIMKSLLCKYMNYRKCPPTAIVVYRDGISTGEFESVFVHEITGIREACIEISNSYRPAISYIVVNKRHNTRFFPNDRNARNVQSGTVVDSHLITNPTTYDFFLNSQYGALGTSRPSHYHVLYDDNKLEPKQMQMLTYALCFMHARCTKAIAIPAPVKYADILATRVAIYLKIDGSSDTESIASGGSRFQEGETKSFDWQTTSERIELSSKLLDELPYFI